MATRDCSRRNSVYRAGEESEGNLRALASNLARCGLRADPLKQIIDVDLEVLA